MKHREITPTVVAVALVVIVLVVVFVGAAAIGGSYFLTLHTLHTTEAAQHAAAIHQAAVQKAAALRECKQLHVLDHAGAGIKFPKVNAAHPSETALTRLFRGIHGVYLASGCSKLGA